MVYRIEVSNRRGGDDLTASKLRAADLRGLKQVCSRRLYVIEGDLSWEDVEAAAQHLLADPVSESATVRSAADPPPGDPLAFEVHPLPGVMDPVAHSTLDELRDEGIDVRSVRTGRRYVLRGDLHREQVLRVVKRVLANDCIEQVVWGSAPLEPPPRPPEYAFALRSVGVREVDDQALTRLSRQGQLFLSLDEMRAIQSYFRGTGRDPTDLELETLAQTWSEHCVHKTLKSAVVYRGAAFGGRPAPVVQEVEVRFENLLADTIARATRELTAERRGPECLSVFEDNAGVIAFDSEYGVAFKVETHNHPSAIEPYGGAATGVGGCIRDVLGCGLGARPIANTDVFCVAPSDWPEDALPRGVLHPRRILSDVVRGVADYGNRMGIPTVSGAVVFDPRYLGNALVYCGCVGIIPRDRIRKAARATDVIVLIGGRTGRDGIHGATFSSAELTDTHADEFAHAVQIGNAITEKRAMDAILRARDEDGCLYTAITDCGAGGLSSAVGEMGAAVGAEVDLERVPLKYSGLRYDEIWISEAQERMVLAVPPERVERLLAIAREEGVEATAIGRFGLRDDAGRPRLAVRYRGQVVGDLEMEFLHEGLPKRERIATWRPSSKLRVPSSEFATAASAPDRGAEPEIRHSELTDQLLASLAAPNARSKAWIIRQYDHEVQGATVVKPLGGPGAGPNDAAVLRPRLDRCAGLAIGCGLAPHLSDVDPYWMALASLDEAVRNVVCVGGDPNRTAVLDNFCWGRTDSPEELGALVRACQACYDGAKAFGTPFISGKDSLNNAFALDAADVEPLLGAIAARFAGRPEGIEGIERQVRRTGRLTIPATLLISAISLIDDVRRCVTADLKPGPDALFLVGGLPQVGFSLETATRIHQAVAGLIRDGFIAACHDVSDGGWLTALVEMAIGGLRGFEVQTEDGLPTAPFEQLCSGYVVQSRDAEGIERRSQECDVPIMRIGRLIDEPRVTVNGRTLRLKELRRAWSSCGAPGQADEPGGDPGTTTH